MIGQLEQRIEMLSLDQRLAVDLDFECGLGQPVAKEHYGSGLVVLSGGPVHAGRLGRRLVQPLGPLARKGVRRCGGIYDVGPVETEALEPFRREVHDLPAALRANTRDNEVLFPQCLDVKNVVSRRSRSIMKYCLHDCAGPGACAVQHRDEISAGSVEGAEPSITATAGIELSGAVSARMYTPERSRAERIEFWGIIGWRAR